MEELNIRNELIDRLKEAIVKRDGALQEMEGRQSSYTHAGRVSEQEIQTFVKPQ